MADEIFIKITSVIFTLQLLILVEKVTLEWLPCKTISLKQAKPIWEKKPKIFLHSPDGEFICSFPRWNKSTAKVCAAYVGHRSWCTTYCSLLQGFIFYYWAAVTIPVHGSHVSRKQHWKHCCLFLSNKSQNQMSRCLPPPCDVFWDAVSVSSCSIRFRNAGAQQNVLSFSFPQQCGCEQCAHIREAQGISMETFNRWHLSSLCW